MILNEPKVYAYISIRTGRKKDEIIANFAKTKLYEEYLKDCFLYIPDDELLSPTNLLEDNMTFSPQKILQVDVMTSTRKNMHFKLNNIVNNAKKEHDGIYRKRINTVLVVTSVNMFGNARSIKEYYKAFRKYGIGVLIPDYTKENGLNEYSTCDFSFNYLPQSEQNRAYDLIENITDDDIPHKQGRKGSEYSLNFRTAFWLYELFKISEDMAVLMSGYSKNGFHMKADNYEQTVSYKNELITMDKKFHISCLIKRNRPVPKNFEKLINYKEKKDKELKSSKNARDGKLPKAVNLTSLELACIHCKVPIIFPVDYKRLILKNEGGKKELSHCLRRYDKELISKFDEWMKSGKNPTEFYVVCNIKKYLDKL